jgi:hypothetical protein
VNDDLREFRPFSEQNRPFWGLGVRWLVTILGLLVVLAIVLGPIGLMLKWYQTGQKVISPENVTLQFRDAYTRFESLKATAGNVCDAQKVYNNESDPGLKAQRQDQLTAQVQNYRRIAAQYDAAYDNAFEAKHVGPTDLPRPAPTLEEETKLYC